MSGYIDDEDDVGTGGAASKPNGNGHEAVSDDDLRELLAKERRARAAEQERAQRAERERDEARGSAATATDQRWVAEEQSLDATLAATEAEAVALEAQIAQLNADGNYAEAGKVYRALARAESQISLVQQKKEWLKIAVEQAKQAPTPRQQSGGVDLAQYSPRQRQWIEDHPEFKTSERFRAKVAAAHYDAAAEGIAVDSDAYFDHIDSRLGGGRQQRQTEADEDPAPRRREVNGGALPVSRRAGGGMPRAGEVRLTAEEREAADDTMGDTPIEDQMVNGVLVPGRYRKYAALKAQLRSQGRLN